MSKFLIVFIFLFSLSSCSYFDKYFKEKKEGDKLYQLDFAIKEDYDIGHYDIVPSSEETLHENLVNNISEKQKNTNHFSKYKNFKMVKLNKSLETLQIIPERLAHINFSPIIFDKKIIINSDKNKVFCFNLDGKKLWEIDLNKTLLRKNIFQKNNQMMNYISIIENQYMVIVSSNGEIAFFEFKENKNLKPKLKWQKDLHEKISSNIAFDSIDKTFYILTTDANLYEINLDGKEIFALKNKKENLFLYENKTSSVFVDENYVIYGDLGGEIFCLDKGTKKILWNIDLNLVRQEESKTIFSGFSYNFIDDGDWIIIPSNLGIIISINKKNGSMKWIREITVGSEIIKNSNFMFFFDINNSLVAMRFSDGKVKWARNFKIQKEYQIPRYLNDGHYKYFNIIYHAPIIVEGEILAINYFGEMFRVSLNTGQIIEKIEIPYYLNSALVFSDGIGYSANFTGGIFATFEENIVN